MYKDKYGAQAYIIGGYSSFAKIFGPSQNESSFAEKKYLKILTQYSVFFLMQHRQKTGRLNLFPLSPQSYRRSQAATEYITDKMRYIWKYSLEIKIIYPKFLF